MKLNLAILSLSEAGHWSRFRGMGYQVQTTSDANKLRINRELSYERGNGFGFTTACSATDIANKKLSSSLIGPESIVGAVNFQVTNLDVADSFCYGKKDDQLLDVSKYTSGFTINSFFNTATNTFFGSTSYPFQPNGSKTAVASNQMKYTAIVTDPKNSSPSFNAPPAWFVNPQLTSCTTGYYQHLNLLPLDPEGNKVSCRWSTFAEAGTFSLYSGTTFIGGKDIYLEPNNCVIRYYPRQDTYKKNHFIAIQVEDFDSSGKRLHSMPVIFQIIKRNASWSYSYKSGDNSTEIEDELVASEEELNHSDSEEVNEAVQFIPEAKHMTYDFYNNLPENENYITEEDNSITTVSEYQEPNLEEIEAAAALEDPVFEAPAGDFDLASSTPSLCSYFPFVAYTGSYITDVTVTSSKQVIKFYIREGAHTSKGTFISKLPRRHVYGPDGLKCGTPNTSGYSLCEWTPNKTQLDQYVHSVSWYGMDATGRYTRYYTRHFRLKDATTVEVACSATSATITAGVGSFLPNLSSSYFSKTVLNIGTCKYTFPSSGTQTRSISLASCGGKWSQGSKIAVEWDVSATDPTTGTITASRVFKFKAKCEYASQVNMMSSAFNVKYGVTTTQISGSSTLDSLFSLSLKGPSSTITIGDKLTGTVTSTFAPSVPYDYQIAACTVYDKSTKTGKKYTVLANQCAPQAAVAFDNSKISGTRTAPPSFSFTSFTFGPSDMNLYMECAVNVCLRDPTSKKLLSSTCLKTCSGK
ncbi:Oidioi.mRNA.OKI2018_I69.chr2.g5353.t1.cds [Oikopleura dioica]|uniref:Oidioi.mRNA.OKI2018_I69.chr2.g5353.t1.cds n=1 Tax=Oikopleura dioica TaxID=34765 RepID=A0ABN7SZN0_OIKDI|nr:Oidioi.mRNA.OKI2018_I69.chr2.g5353.t1.cds [Oikopleura dioica]